MLTRVSSAELKVRVKVLVQGAYQGECRMRSSHPTFVLLVLLSALSCARQSAPISPSPRDMTRIAAITVVSPGFAIGANTSFAWRSDVIWSDDDLRGSTDLLARSDVRRVIEAELARKGADFALPDEAPEYLIVAAIQVGSGEPEGGLQEIVQLYPALRAVSHNLDKGTLLVAISLPGSSDLLWRGAVQVFLIDSGGRSEREARLESAVRNLFINIPRR